MGTFSLDSCSSKKIGVEYSSYFSSPPLFTLRQSFSQNLIFIGYCSNNGVSRQMKYKFDFFRPRKPRSNLSVMVRQSRNFWSTRSLITLNHFQHNNDIHMGNLDCLFLYTLCTILQLAKFSPEWYITNGLLLDSDEQVFLRERRDIHLPIEQNLWYNQDIIFHTDFILIMPNINNNMPLEDLRVHL